MAKKTQKIRAANLPVPQTKDDAIESVTQVGELQRQVTRLEADMNDRIAAIKTAFEQQAEPLRIALDEKIQGLQIWAEANRAALTGGDKTKTVDLGTGVLKWRLRPPSVRLTGVEAIIAVLKQRGLRRFLRIKEEINKDALAAERDVAIGIPGVAIGSEGEDFIVEPAEMKLAEGAAA